MKYHSKRLQSLVAVALCVIMAFAIAGCSKDDDEPASDNLSSIIVGIWAQDGDDDIMVFNANGTGMFYESPADYAQKEVSYNFNWNLKGEWLTMNIDYGDGSYDDQMKCRPENIVSIIKSSGKITMMMSIMILMMLLDITGFGLGNAIPIDTIKLNPLLSSKGLI